jgi:protein involved in polysaccharide export with SLBB domain
VNIITIKRDSYRKDFLYILILVLVSVNLAGCASYMNQSKVEAESVLPEAKTLQPVSPASPVQAEEKEYVLQPGDVISVAFFYFPRLDTTVKIRPDGYISLSPIDDVKAAGLNTRELDEKLTRLYAERIENPELTVTVKEFATQKIYVGGEVKSAGFFDLENNMTSLQAIFKAGGALNTGNLESVIIIRREKDGSPRLFSVNLKQDLESRKITNDIYLNSLDVVYIPQTMIARIDQFVEQYIDKLLPISLHAGFDFVKNLGGVRNTVVVSH